jgi:hypothetical protein
VIIRKRRNAYDREPDKRRKRGTVTLDIHDFTLISFGSWGPVKPRANLNAGQNLARNGEPYLFAAEH